MTRAEQIKTPLSVYKAAEWCSSFVIVPKAKWEGLTMSRPSKAQPSITKTSS